jgi:CubicO group peptidase (beta-lactamase class C family)
MKQVISVILLGMIIYGCQQAEDPSGDVMLGAVSPSEAGFYADSLASIKEFLSASVDSNKIPGAVAMIVKDGAVVYKTAVGMADIEQNEEMQPDHIFRLASMTKPVTSVAILMLDERDSLSVNDPVSEYIPEFADARVLNSVDMADTTWTSEPVNTPLTIHHLLTHTSGIAYGFIDEELGPIYAKGQVPDGTVMDGRTIEETMAQLGNLPLKHQPGEQWTYGLSTDVLGRIVEVASGKPLDQFFREEIFGPLGMDSTGFNLPDELEDDLAALYRNNKEYSLQRVYQLSIQENDSVNVGDQGMPDITYFSGGSGLMGTAQDYQHFLQAVLNDGRLGETRIYGEDTSDFLKQNQIADLRLGRDGFSYGFLVTLPDGELINSREPGRLQWGGLFQTYFWIDPVRNSTVVLMTQVFPSQHQDELYGGFEQRVNSAYR